ncbi:MAG: DUF87 domain-containing protein [Candidatus Lokiarchaeota archaeon]|nr:DUF87 domain-containing protein [Candidatus Lokiarchaeota archaeon]
MWKKTKRLRKITDSEDLVIGKVISVTNEYINAKYEKNIHTFSPIIGGKTVRIGEIGAWVKIDLGIRNLIGEIIEVSINPIEIKNKYKEFTNVEERFFKIKLIGELSSDEGFIRGIVHYPSIDDEIKTLKDRDWKKIYPPPDENSELVYVGKLKNLPNRKAHVYIDKLVSRHFLIAGMTGSGKSNFAAVLITNILKSMRTPHILLFDIFGEYINYFRSLNYDDHIQILSPTNDSKPYLFPVWLLTIDEINDIFHIDFSDPNLKKLIYGLKLEHFIEKEEKGESGLFPNEELIDAETPIPIDFKKILSRIKFCNNAVVTRGNKNSEFITDKGKIQIEEIDFFCLEETNGEEITIENATFQTSNGSSRIYHKYHHRYSGLIKTLQDILENRRYFHFFPTPNDFSLKEWYEAIKSLFSKKLTIIDLSDQTYSLRKSIIRVILSKLLAIYQNNSEHQLSPFFLLLEESHKFIEIKEIYDILREYRKFGLGIGLISQRPSKISDNTLSQIGTYGVLRMTNERDIQIMQQILPDHYLTTIPRLPILQTGEMILMGEASPRPQYIKVPPLTQKKEGSDPYLIESWNREDFSEDLDNLEEILKKILTR